MMDKRVYAVRLRGVKNARILKRAVLDDYSKFERRGELPY